MPTTPIRGLGLSRDQLATFLRTHEQIKQFEALFSVLSDVVISEEISSGTAEAAYTSAVLALGEIASVTAATGASLSALEGRVNQLLSIVTEQRKAIEGLQSAPPPKESKRTRYGSFYDTTTQTATAINTAKEITFNTTDLSYGVYRGSPTSRIYVDTEGVYNFQTSIQLDSTVATDEEFYLWFRKNGVDVTDSASQVRVKGNNAEVFLSLNYFFDLKPGDYVELVFSVTDLGVRLLAVAAAAPHPGIPSIILTVSNNIRSY